MQGKTILVTGGAKRVGAAIVRRLHAAGANVAIHFRSSAYEAFALRGELNDLRENSAICVQADLLETSALPRMVDEVVQHFNMRPDAEVTISIEIRAETRSGFDEGIQRTVRENCKELKFGNAEFEG